MWRPANFRRAFVIEQQQASSTVGKRHRFDIRTSSPTRTSWRNDLAFGALQNAENLRVIAPAQPGDNAIVAGGVGNFVGRTLENGDDLIEVNETRVDDLSASDQIDGGRLRAGLHIPLACGSVLGNGRQSLGRRGRRRWLRPLSCGRQNGNGFSRCRVPDPCCLVLRRGGDEPAIGAEGNMSDRFLMSAKFDMTWLSVQPAKHDPSAGKRNSCNRAARVARCVQGTVAIALGKNGLRLEPLQTGVQRRSAAGTYGRSRDAGSLELLSGKASREMRVPSVVLPLPATWVDRLDRNLDWLERAWLRCFSASAFCESASSFCDQAQKPTSMETTRAETAPASQKRPRRAAAWRLARIKSRSSPGLPAGPKPSVDLSRFRPRAMPRRSRVDRSAAGSPAIVRRGLQGGSAPLSNRDR